nr:hypothetical protein [Tanacetum cinerariifolium]
MSLVTSVSRSTIKEEEVVGIVGPGYGVPLRVVIPFRSSFELVIVLPGRVPEHEDEAAEESGVDEPELVNRGLIGWCLVRLRLVLTFVSSLLKVCFDHGGEVGLYSFGFFHEPSSRLLGLSPDTRERLDCI